MLTKSWPNSLFIFLSCDRQGADGYGPGRGYGRGMSGRTGGRGFGNGKFINYCPKFEFNFAVEFKILKLSLLLLSRNGKENAATRIYMPSLQCSWYVCFGEYFVIIDGYGSSVVTSVYGFIASGKKNCVLSVCCLTQDILFSTALQMAILHMMLRELNHLLVFPSLCLWRPQMALILCQMAQLQF